MMDQATGSLGDAITRWAEWPTAKHHTGVRHALARLLDELAPETTPRRGAPPPRRAIERHRSPNGCILQADASAVSVSWFAPPFGTSELGELVIILWNGVVSHPGSARRERDGATTVRRIALRPIQIAPGTWAWQETDDLVYDSAALAARCRALLDDQSA